MFKFFRGKDKTAKDDPNQQLDQALVQDEAAVDEPTLGSEPGSDQLEPLAESEESQAEASQEISPSESEVAETSNEPEPVAASEPEPSQPKKGWFGRLRSYIGGEKAETPAPEPVAETEESRPESLEETPPEVASLPSAPEPEVESPPLSEVVTPVAALESAPEPEVESPTLSEVVTTVAAPLEPEALVEPAQPVKPESPEALASDLESSDLDQQVEDQSAAEADQPAEESESEEKPKKGWFSRLKQKLANTRDRITGRIEKILPFSRAIDEDVLEELEEILITSDLGVKTTDDLLTTIRDQVKRKELKDSEALKAALRARLLEVIDLEPKPRPQVKPLVILMVGVNGVGKTTTIAKLARRYQEEGLSVLLAAGDTFRAAAVEQLTIWAQRTGSDIVSQPTGADASAVVFDALNAAKARGADVVIIDTAGRLHTKVNLMEELKKIKRVANKAYPGAPHETILVLDANTGQNAASQARTFHESIGVDSLIITKLDGTSKGGVVVSIINDLRLPVTFIGLGETYGDLRPFDAADFVEAIMGTSEL
ncbi:MAG: signal recognition particle-docking protein FtsY [Deltaproteobacteria bacterium]|jgi:fused signal recognition particle receptor|nr:signal recognition particle-docking protein FtsY [Deltaproteobacteria bacterium]